MKKTIKRNDTERCALKSTNRSMSRLARARHSLFHINRPLSAVHTMGPYCPAKSTRAASASVARSLCIIAVSVCIEYRSTVNTSLVAASCAFTCYHDVVSPALVLTQPALWGQKYPNALKYISNIKKCFYPPKHF